MGYLHPQKVYGIRSVLVPQPKPQGSQLIQTLAQHLASTRPQ